MAKSMAAEHCSAATVSVVVPALNEADSISWVLENLPAWVAEVIVVDGLSTDATERVARAIRPDVVVVHQRRRGKGAALRAGFAAASSDIIVMIDADGSTDPREMDIFVRALEDGADFVKGSRHMRGGGSVDYTRLRAAGNRGFVALANLLYGSDFTDLCYGYCAFWRHHLDALALSADGFEIETQLVLNAVKAQLVIREVPSFELMRRAGVSNLSAYRDGRRVLETMFREHPARAGREPLGPVPITLQPIEVAAPESAQWVPAGLERRRADRRRLDRQQSAHAGTDRRGGDRRIQPVLTTIVHVAGDANVIDLRPPLPKRAVAGWWPARQSA